MILLANDLHRDSRHLSVAYECNQLELVHTGAFERQKYRLLLLNVALVFVKVCEKQRFFIERQRRKTIYSGKSTYVKWITAEKKDD